MKSILFVINTLGRGGAETALISLLNSIDTNAYEADLFVLLGQGDLIHRIPEHVRLLNETFDDSDVLGKEGRKHIISFLRRTVWKHGSFVRNIPYLIRNAIPMIRAGKIHPDKLLWKVISDSAPRFEKQYDLAVGFLEGGSSYYVADHVISRKKACFVHTFYEESGYSRTLDLHCFEAYDRIFTVGEENRKSFLRVYPEHMDKTEVFHNIINKEDILEKSLEPGGFRDDFSGARLLTVARLNAAKALPVSVRAMRILKDAGRKVRWYVLGEGEERHALEVLIIELSLEDDFLLCGLTDNPYPYYRQCDLYLHCSKYEGRSIALQEAQVCGCTVIASDIPANSSQIQDGRDGILVSLDPQKIAEAVCRLLDHPEEAEELGRNAAKIDNTSEDLPKLLALMNDR